MKVEKFKGCHFPKCIVLQAVYWYLRYPLSYQDIEELMEERGIDVDHSTLQRWIEKYTPLIDAEFRKTQGRRAKPLRVELFGIRAARQAPRASAQLGKRWLRNPRRDGARGHLPGFPSEPGIIDDLAEHGNAIVYQDRSSSQIARARSRSCS